MLSRQQWNDILQRAGVQGVAMPPPNLRPNRHMPIPANYMQQIQQRQQGPPPATQGMPQVEVPEVRESLIKQKTGEEGSWTDIFTTPLKYLGRALSAGEFGVASMLRAMIRSSEGKEAENPAMALLKGFAAGFTGDQEFDYTISELIENEWGWDPEGTWSAENIAQEGIGLLAGILFDPITYALSFGAKGIHKFTASTLTKTGKDSGIIIDKAMRGMATSKLGDKAIQAVSKARSGIAGKAGKILDPVDITRAMEAGNTAQQDFIKMMLSANQGDLATRITTEKGIAEMAEAALKKLGKRGGLNDTNLKYLTNTGYKKLLDRAGIKFFNHTLLPTKLPGKFTEGIFGGLMSQAVEKKIPLFGKPLRAGAEFADTVLRSSLDGMQKLFSLEGKLGSEGAQLINRLQSTREIVDDFTKRYSAGLMTGSAKPINELTVPGLGKVTLPELSQEALSRQSQKMLGTLMHYGDSAGIDTFELGKYLRDNSPEIADVFINWRGKKVFLKDLPQGVRDNIARAAENMRTTFDKLRALDSAMVSPGGDLYRKEYMTRIVKFKDKRTIKKLGEEYKERLPFYDNARVKDAKFRKDFTAWYNDYKSKPYTYEFDPQTIVQARMRGTLMRAAMEDTMQQAINRGLLGSKKAALSEYLMRHPEFVEKHPRLAYAVLEQSAPMKGALTEQATNKFKEFYDPLVSMDPQKIGDHVIEEVLPQNISRGGAKLMKDRYQALVDEMYTRSKRSAADPDFGKRYDALREAQEIFNERVDDMAAQNEVSGALADMGLDDPAKIGIARKVLNKAAEVAPIGESTATDFVHGIAEKIGTPGVPLMKQSKVTLDKIDDILSGAVSKKQKDQIKKFVRVDVEQDADALMSKLPGIKVKDPVTGSVRSLDSLGVDRRFAQEVVDVFRPGALDKKGMTGLYKAVDTVTNPLKRFLTVQQFPGIKAIPRVGFVGRNIVDLAFRSTTMLGLKNIFGDPQAWKQAGKVMLGDKQALKIINGEGAEYLLKVDDLLRVLDENGLLRHEIGQRIGIGTRRGAKVSEITRRWEDSTNYLRTLQRDVVQAVSGKTPKALKSLHAEALNVGTENLFMVKNALELLHRGHSFDEVIKKLNLYMFSYNNMTSFERGFMRRAVMFYPFQRQAIPFVLEQLKNKPAMFHALGNLQHAAFESQEEEAAAPPWIREFPMLRGRVKDGNLELISMRNLFTLDTIADLVPKQMHQLFGQINPILTIVPEIMMGHDLYFNKPIGEGIDELGVLKARKKLKWQKMSQFLAKSPLGEFLDYQEFTYPSNGQKAVTVNAAKWHLTKRLWFSRLYRELNEFGQMIQGDLDKSKWLSLFFTGVRTYDLDLEKQMQFLNYEAQNYKKMYDRAVSRGDKKTANAILEKIRIPDGG